MTLKQRLKQLQEGLELGKKLQDMQGFHRKEYELVPHGSGRRVYVIDHREPMILPKNRC